MKSPERKSYLFIIGGSIEVEGITLHERDGLGLEDLNNFEVKAISDSFILNIEI